MARWSDAEEALSVFSESSPPHGGILELITGLDQLTRMTASHDEPVMRYRDRFPQALAGT